MDLATVKMIWRHMRDSNESFYFYSEQETPTDSTTAQLIRSELKKQPDLLPEKLFKLLKKFSLILTPEEECRRLFRNSPPVASVSDFGRNILRALSACLSMSEKFHGIHIVFVDGAGTDHDFTFDEEQQLMLIHQKWFHFQKIHDGYPCETQRLLLEEQLDSTAFFCDHVVEDLLDAILPDLSNSFEMDISERRSHRRLARDGLRLMPRLVQTMQSDHARTLEVSWIGNESGLVSEKHSKHIQYYVVLHKESLCETRRKDAVHWTSTYFAGPEINVSQQEPSQNYSMHHCGCPYQIVSRSESRARFENLKGYERYFPMVARAEAPSFFGTPPLSIAPRSTPAIVPLTPERRTRTSVASSPSSSRQNRHPRDILRPPVQVIPQSPIRRDNNLIAERNLEAVCEQDEAEWRQWFKDVLPIEFSKLTVHPGSFDVQSEHSMASLTCEHLNFCFEKGEYARIQLSDDKSSEHPVLIHNIFYSGDEVRLATTYLLVTKYSTLRSTILFQNRVTTTNSSAPEADKELLLHFRDFDKMGLQDDAELVRLEEITHASRLFPDAEDDLDYIKYVRKVPQDNNGGPLLCRFAIRRTNNTTEACLTPVASHLLSRPDRWREVRFPIASQPVILDFTPGILGPSEGFAQAGFSVAAGIGFDPQRHMTWKVRHGSSHVYDGLPSRVLQDMSDGLLVPPNDSLHAVAPRIAVIASGNGPFRLNNQNRSMPSLIDFVDVLNKADNAIRSALEPDFLVVLSSPALLHSLAAGRLATSLLALLDHRFSVHLKLCSMQALGTPYERDVLVLVASSLCAPMSWDTPQDSHDNILRSTVRSLIQDLAFNNPRTTLNVPSAFVCSRPQAQEQNLATPRNSHVYNHRTGVPTSNPPLTLNWDTEMLLALTAVPKQWSHPSRQDLLTVRELARLQGFPDDFIFYLSEASQYEDVWIACPPAVTKLVGEGILRIVRGLSAAKMGDQTMGSRSNKRARVE